MQIKEIQDQIIKKNPQKVYLFYGNEPALMDIYISKLVELFGGNKIHVETASQAYSRLTRKMLAAKPGCIVLRNDQQFFKDPKAWGKLFSAVKYSKSCLVVVYDTMDKRSKYYKQNQDRLCEFSRMNPSILSKYVKKELPTISDRSAESLCEVCECDYSRVLLECSKIKAFADHHKISYDESYKELIKRNVIYQPIGDITFDFVDAILLRRKSQALMYSQQAKECGESPILTLSVLYTGLKNVFLLQTLDDMSAPAKETGLTPWQVKNAKMKMNHYSDEELVRAMQIVRKAERGIKLGEFNPDNAVDYVIVNIM